MQMEMVNVEQLVIRRGAKAKMDALKKMFPSHKPVDTE
jgi:hypothetical protein